MNGNVPRAIITAKDLKVRYNDITVLDGASLTITAGDRIGMVGRNGSGKSTFLKILAGARQPDSGEVTRRRDLLISYLPQEFALEPEKTVFENIRAGAGHVLRLIAEFESLPGDSPRHVELEERIDAWDGWNLDTRIHAAMSHLNVPDGELVVDTLSGGEKRRVALCRAIISRPDLLLLDEPTNHLDNESIEWMGDFLRNYPGAFVIVTHDRWFLDSITSSIVELANGVCYSYTGNYGAYLEAKANRQAIEDALENKRQSFLRRELDWVRRGPKARTTKAKSRLDRFHEAATRETPDRELEVDLVVPPPPPLGNRIVDLRNVGMELGGKVLFQGLEFSFEAGMRIGVVGRNGVGKTTLLRTILGELRPTTGTVKPGKNTEFNYIDQGRLILNEEKTVLEEVSDGTEFVMFGAKRLSLRGYLKRFLFADERMDCTVKYLSGGERSRLLLARILKRGGNFIILDEPTNDLDLPTLRVLEEALIAFPGCVVVVSHDRYFLNRVCNGILAFEGNGAVNYSVGNYDYYLEKKNRESSASAKSESGRKAKKNSLPNEAKPRRLTYKEIMELEDMEDQILRKEEEVHRLESLFSAPDFHEKHAPRTRELLAELETLKNDLKKLYERWEELEAVKAGSK